MYRCVLCRMFVCDSVYHHAVICSFHNFSFNRIMRVPWFLPRAFWPYSPSSISIFQLFIPYTSINGGTEEG